MTQKIEISPDQLTATSEHGTFNFYPVKKEKSNTCQKCWFGRSPMGICRQIPCLDYERNDGKNGYFSIHDMPVVSRIQSPIANISL